MLPTIVHLGLGVFLVVGGAIVIFISVSRLRDKLLVRRSSANGATQPEGSLDIAAQTALGALGIIGGLGIEIVPALDVWATLLSLPFMLVLLVWVAKWLKG